jgi:hypothetical protein
MLFHSARKSRQEYPSGLMEIIILTALFRGLGFALPLTRHLNFNPLLLRIQLGNPERSHLSRARRFLFRRC